MIVLNECHDDKGQFCSGEGTSRPDNAPVKGLPSEIELGENFYQYHDAVKRNTFQFSAAPSPYARDSYDIKVKPKIIPEGWKKTADRNGEWYDPKYVKEIKEESGYRHLVLLEPNADIYHPEGKESGFIFRGMSYDEYENILDQGYIESRGGYNFESQQGITYYSTNKDQAAYYASGFAPWQYKATPDKPAVMLKVKDPGNHIKIEGTGEDEVGIRGRVSIDQIDETYLGHPVIIREGEFEVRTGRWFGKKAETGSRRDYSAVIRWEKSTPHHQLNANPCHDEQGKFCETGSKPYERSGKELGNVFSGGKTYIKEIDPSKLQSRDSGFYGTGFYVTSSPTHAKTYGSKITEFEIDPGAKVLYSEINPRDASPALIKAVTSDYYNRSIDRAKEKGKEDSLLAEIEHIKTSPTGWHNAVDAYAELHGYDIVRHSDGEIVVKNPNVLHSKIKKIRNIAGGTIPLPNFHSARIRDPGDFIDGSFRTKELPESKSIQLVMGKLKGGDGSMVAASYRFPIDQFTAEEAKTWLKENDVKNYKFEPAKKQDEAGWYVEKGDRLYNAAPSGGIIAETDDYIDVSVIPIKEGVFTGSDGIPTLKKFEEFAPYLHWLDGVPITRGHGDVLHTTPRPGKILNTQPDPENRRARAVGRYFKQDLTPSELERLHSDLPKDGSIEYRAVLVDQPGEFQGVHYDREERGPYHFYNYAEVPIGACRPPDCGILLNSSINCPNKDKNEGITMSEELDKEMASLNAALEETKKQLNAANEKITAQDAKIADLEMKLTNLGQLPDQVKQLNEAHRAEKRQMLVAEFAKHLNAAHGPEAEKLFAEAESDPLWFAKNKDKLMNEATRGQGLLGGKVPPGGSSGVEAARQKMIEALHA